MNVIRKPRIADQSDVCPGHFAAREIKNSGQTGSRVRRDVDFID
jgi:hypothetical protein